MKVNRFVLWSTKEKQHYPKVKKTSREIFDMVWTLPPWMFTKFGHYIYFNEDGCHWISIMLKSINGGGKSAITNSNTLEKQKNGFSSFYGGTEKKSKRHNVIRRGRLHQKVGEQSLKGSIGIIAAKTLMSVL